MGEHSFRADTLAITGSHSARPLHLSVLVCTGRVLQSPRHIDATAPIRGRGGGGCGGNLSQLFPNTHGTLRAVVPV